jgi:hypothetical protein
MALWSGSIMAQKRSSGVDAWYFPGLTYQVTPATKLSAQAIWFGDAKAAGVLLRGFVKVSKHITLQPGYLFLSEGVAGHPEHGLFNGVIYNCKLWGLQLEDRNILWDRFRRDASAIHVYRNRLKVSRLFSIGDHAASVYAYDEAFYHFTEGLWSRNRLSVGCAYDVIKQLNLDLSYVHQGDHFSGSANLLWVMATVQL